jgi:hypothetical protein
MKLPKIIGSFVLCALSLTALAASKAEDPLRNVGLARAYIAARAPTAQLDCHKNAYKYPECTADGYEIGGYGCDGDGFYAGVYADDGVTLADNISLDLTQPIAHLSKGQFVCIQIVGKKEETLRYYIQAVPVATVENCKDNAICTDYGERPVQWFKPVTGKPCTRAGTNFTRRGYVYTGDCAAGWVDKETLDEFSMGLKPQ